jgi:mono/diheme cytochrome c family protein
MNRTITTLAASAFASFVLAASAAAQQPAAAPAPDGAALYKRLCSNCHGETGTPTDAMKQLLPALVVLSDSTLQAGLSADSIVVVLNGVGSGKHKKPFSDRMSHDEMVAVAAYVKTFQAAHAP